MKQVLRSILFSKNKVTAINTFAVGVIRYTAAIYSWKQKDLKEPDIGIRKLMTMHGVVYRKLSTTRLYTSGKKEKRGLCNLENVVRQEEQSFKSYVSRKNK